MRTCLGRVVVFLLLAPVLSPVAPLAVQAADKQKPPKSPDPYGTAKQETAPALAAADLAYRVVVFDEIEIPENLKKDNAKYVDQTETQAIARLRGTKAFTNVDRKTEAVPEEPYLLVKCVVLDHRIVGKGTRVLAGTLAGKSKVTYQVRLLDGKSGDLLYDTKLSTANNPFSGTLLGNDKKLTVYLGKVIGDYVALRARTDKGLSVIPPDWPPAAK
jgi:hypothetical protein